MKLSRQDLLQSVSLSLLLLWTSTTTTDAFVVPSTSFGSSTTGTTTSFVGKRFASAVPGSSSSALCMKTVAVIGASGLTASECVYQALKDGYNVVGLTRNPANLVVPKGSGGDGAGSPLNDDDKLTMIGGDVTKMEDCAKVIDAAIATASNDLAGVVVALGGKTSEVGDTMLTVGTQNIVSLLKEKAPKARLVVVSSIGAGDSKDQAPFFFKILMATAMKKIFVDKNNQEAAVQASGLDYCIVRPGGLTVEPPTGVINVIEGEAGSIARADVAQFCLDAIFVDDFPYIGKAPCISSVGGTSWVKDRSKTAREGMSS